MKYAATFLVIGLSALACSGNNGSNGANGNDGTNGASAMIATTPEPPGGNCRAGGTRVTFGVDDDGDGVLGDGEVDYTSYECQESTCLVVAGGRCAGADLRNLTIVGVADYAGDLIGLGTGDLTGIDLSSADLSNAVLIGVSFINANLAGARLDGAIIQRATFVSSDLTGASMRGTYMAQVTMSDVDATGLDLSASAIIAQARLLNSNFTNARFEGTVFPPITELQRSNFTGARFVDTTFAATGVVDAGGAIFTNADFTDANFGETNWASSTPSPTFTGAVFDYASFFAANLTNLTIGEAASFTNAYFNSPGTILPVGFVPLARGALVVSAGANLVGADFTHAQFSAAVSFDGLNLTNADFSGRALGASTFVNANMSGAKLVGTSRFGSLAGANATGADFTDADLSGSNLAGTDLGNAKLVRANVNVSTIDDDISGADFTHATLFNVDVSDATGGASAVWTGAFRTPTTTLPPILPAGTNVRIIPNGVVSGADLSGLWLPINSTALASVVNLSNVDFTGAHLVGVDLTGRNLTNANFTDADLSQADFEYAILVGANFTRARLLNASLAGADATGANFTSALALQATLVATNATNANFTNADLSCANMLIGADAIVIPATLTGATLSNTTCPDLTVIASGAATACDNHVIVPPVVGSPVINHWSNLKCSVISLPLILATEL